MDYLDAFQVIEAMTRLAMAHPQLCQHMELGHSDGGKALAAMRLHDRNATGLIPLVIIGGVHGREWAPPDALVSFAQRLVDSRSRGTDIVYPVFRSGGVTYSQPNYRIDAAGVREIFSRFDLMIFPLVNPDGRDFSRKGLSGTPTAEERLWRKSRRKVVTGGAESCRGVDINRNFPMAWDHRKYYNPAAAAKVVVSEDACHKELYKGPQPASEAETRAVMQLVVQNRTNAFLDVHMSGRQVMFPWGVERNQVLIPRQSFLETSFDRQRDGLQGNNYSEFLKTDTHDRLKGMANVIANEIIASAGANAVAQQRSDYKAIQSVDAPNAIPGGTLVGCSDDWAFSRQFSAPTSAGEVFAFTLEAGKEQNPANPGEEHDGGFFPNFQTQFPKVEREIHAAVFGLLRGMGWKE